MWRGQWTSWIVEERGIVGNEQVKGDGNEDSRRCNCTPYRHEARGNRPMDFLTVRSKQFSDPSLSGAMAVTYQGLRPIGMFSGSLAVTLSCCPYYLCSSTPSPCGGAAAERVI